MAVGTRAFRAEDIAEVARLWLKAFRRRSDAPPDPLLAYFHELFFDAPWRDPALPSLVCEDASGIVAFLGVLPRTMMFRGERLRVAVGTQLMTDDSPGAGYAAVRLLRKFFAGPQDLSFSDGATEGAERLWRAGGGDVAPMDSLTWVRVLRPIQYAAATFRPQSALRPAIRAMSPLYQLIDVALVRNGLGRRYWAPRASRLEVDIEPTDDTILWCVRHLAGDRALHPAYEPDAFRWLLRKAAEKRMHGTLLRGVVRAADQSIVGWYLFYANPGAVAQVLQFGARDRFDEAVLNCLLHHAWRLGAAGVSGKFEFRYAKALAKARCTFTWPGYGTLVHARNRAIIDAIAHGDAFLSRLEGEWWSRFSDVDLSRRAPKVDVLPPLVTKELPLKRVDAA